MFSPQSIAISSCSSTQQPVDQLKWVSFTNNFHLGSVKFDKSCVLITMFNCNFFHSWLWINYVQCADVCLIKVAFPPFRLTCFQNPFRPWRWWLLQYLRRWRRLTEQRAAWCILRISSHCSNPFWRLSRISLGHIFSIYKQESWSHSFCKSCSFYCGVYSNIPFKQLQKDQIWP